MSTAWVTIGTVVKPHGLRGEVVVHPLSDVPGRFDPGQTVAVDGAHTHIVAMRPHQGRLLVTFADIADRTQAESLRGADVTAAPLDPDDHDTYFVHELVGMPVRGVDGGMLGTVSAWIELPAAADYDLLEVRRSDGSTWLLPAVEDYVAMVETEVSVELQLVDPPAGLVDLADADSER
ncbi:MAG: ribosome maturation factor RimM [Nitriliruptoraceae bacterium]